MQVIALFAERCLVSTPALTTHRPILTLDFVPTDVKPLTK